MDEIWWQMTNDTHTWSTKELLIFFRNRATSCEYLSLSLILLFFFVFFSLSLSLSLSLSREVDNTSMLLCESRPHQRVETALDRLSRIEIHLFGRADRRSSISANDANAEA